MILICGISSEPPVRMAIEAAERAEIPHLIFDQRKTDHYELSVDFGEGGGSGVLLVDGTEVPLHEIDGLYSRMMEPEMLPEVREGKDPEKAARILAMQHLLLEWIEGAPCRVANRSAPMASNTSKPYQALKIAALDIRVPDTLVTNEPRLVSEFKELHGALIYKSISSVRSIVRSVEDGKSLDGIRHLPTQFQERLTGSDVRVHVVGDEVFPTAVETQAVDYRYARGDDLDVELTPTQLPREIEDRCRALSLELGLPFCGIDLRLTDEGDYACFEVNPSPAYSYYELATGQGISDALVRYLAHGRSQESGVKIDGPSD